MNKIEADTYVIVENESRNSLVRVTNYSQDLLLGYEERNDEVIHVEIQDPVILAVLDNDPKIGRVYGCSTERLLKITELPDGVVAWWYFKPNKEQRVSIKKSISRALRILEENDLPYPKELYRIKVTKNPAKKLASKTIVATYTVHARTNEEHGYSDTLNLRYHPDMKDIPKTILHEIFHGLWIRYLPETIRYKWLSVFVGLTEVNRVTKEEVAKVKKAFLVDGDGLYETPEQEAITHGIFAHLEDHYALRKKDINMLCSQGTDEMWYELIRSIPSTATTYSAARETHVSEYAATNVEEFFCEAMSFYLYSGVTPKYLKRLVQTTKKVLTTSLSNV